MFYNKLKEFIKKSPSLWNFARGIKNYLIKFSRLQDVLMMFILFHIWPEQTYRFSTRKLLPCKKNRFSKKSKPVIPYDLLKSKCSNMHMMKEIHVVGIGSSFDLNDLERIDGPIFLVSFCNPLRVDVNGKVFYVHPNANSYETNKKIDLKELFNDQTNREYKKNNMTYVVSRENVIRMFKKNGNKVISNVTYGTNKDGNHYPLSKVWVTPSYLNLFDHDQCKRMSVADKVYRPPLLKPYSDWTPIGSFLLYLCALSNFAEKINVYGWDFYLNSSPENMGYWELFFNMYKYKADVNRSLNHFESALINFYYGYQLSKLPNMKIHGYMGKLGKHHKLIRRIERVLFN